jgi:hypothetical protein
MLAIGSIFKHLVEHLTFVRTNVNTIAAGFAHLLDDLQCLLIVLLVFGKGDGYLFYQLLDELFHYAPCRLSGDGRPGVCKGSISCIE